MREDLEFTINLGDGFVTQKSLFEKIDLTAYMNLRTGLIECAYWFQRLNGDSEDFSNWAIRMKEVQEGIEKDLGVNVMLSLPISEVENKISKY